MKTLRLQLKGLDPALVTLLAYMLAYILRHEMVMKCDTFKIQLNATRINRVWSFRLWVLVMILSWITAQSRDLLAQTDPGDENRAPQILPIAPMTVLEGENVTFDVAAIDPDDDDIELFAANLIPGSEFSQTSPTQGVFRWQAPYIGQGSATHSPYLIEVMAFDGQASAGMSVRIDVVNVNRPPMVTIGANLSGLSGDEVFIPFAASDPDFDAVSFSLEGLPDVVEFNGSNPGFIKWSSTIADSGDYHFNLTAIDEHGGATTEFLTLQLLQSAPVELTIGETQGFPGEYVDLYIEMQNRVSVAAFDLVVDIDKSVLTLIEVDTAGTRLGNWSRFEYTVATDGRLFIHAEADSISPATNYLNPGDGPIARMRLSIPSATEFAGFYSRVEFAFIDPVDDTENAAYEPDGDLIPRSQINYTSGGVLIKLYDGLVGDINLNGVAFEIGDLVYFTNFFINPAEYPLTGERWMNSDINQNGNPGELADLIMMIQIIDGGSGKALGTATRASAEYSWDQSEGTFRFHFQEPAGFAAALISLELAEATDLRCYLVQGTDQFELHVGRQEEQVRILVVSRDGSLVDVAESADFLMIQSQTSVVLRSAEFVDEFGAEVLAERHEKSVLPDAYQLEQNFPNPFNPKTTISFETPTTSHASVEVYNILGEKISTLVDKVLPAGRHQLIFSGRDRSDRELPSGIYFYRLRTEMFEATRKMILLK